MLRSQQAWNNSNKYSFIGGEFKASHAEHSSLFIIAFVFLCIGVSSFLIFFGALLVLAGKGGTQKENSAYGLVGGFYYYTKTYYYHLSYYIMPDGLTMAFREILRSVETNNEYVFTITLISQDVVVSSLGDNGLVCA
jgi:hypothetical protein